MDNRTPEERHLNMSHIRSTNSKPEEIVRKYLFSRGLRYRKNEKRLPGKPDIVLKKYNTVIFINGCFWHHHDCERFKWPKTNESYWKEKIDRNVSRDMKNNDLLRQQGWKVITVWECQLKSSLRKETLEELYNSIISDF